MKNLSPLLKKNAIGLCVCVCVGGDLAHPGGLGIKAKGDIKDGQLNVAHGRCSAINISRGSVRLCHTAHVAVCALCTEPLHAPLPHSVRDGVGAFAACAAANEVALRVCTLVCAPVRTPGATDAQASSSSVP